MPLSLSGVGFFLRDCLQELGPWTGLWTLPDLVISALEGAICCC